MSDLESLIERKNYYHDRSRELLLSDDYDQDELEDALFMYSNYINVIADMRDTLTQTDQQND